MSTTLIEVRPAKPADASAVASTHDEAWRNAYQGIIPGAEHGQGEKSLQQLRQWSAPPARQDSQSHRIATANQIQRIFP